MKKLSLIFLFLFLTKTSLGCTCANSWASTNNQYITSDYVGKIKITKTYDSKSKKARSYRADIKSIENFKGKAPQSLTLRGNRGFESGVIIGCSTNVQKGEVWLIYTSKNSSGEYYISYCSFPQRLKNADGLRVELSDSERRDLKQLAFLKRTVPKLDRDFMIFEDTNKIGDYLEQYKGKRFDKSSAQYLVSFDQNMQIKSIETLRGFSDEFDSSFTHFLKSETKWYGGDHGMLKEYRKYNLSKPTKHVIGVYYYNDENEEPFISDFDIP